MFQTYTDNKKLSTPAAYVRDDYSLPSHHVTDLHNHLYICQLNQFQVKHPWTFSLAGRFVRHKVDLRQLAKKSTKLRDILLCSGSIKYLAFYIKREIWNYGDQTNSGIEGGDQITMQLIFEGRIEFSPFIWLIFRLSFPFTATMRCSHLAFINLNQFRYQK